MFNLVTRSKPIAFSAEGQYCVNNHAHCIDSTNKLILEYLCLYINAISFHLPLIQLIPHIHIILQAARTHCKNYITRRLFSGKSCQTSCILRLIKHNLHLCPITVNHKFLSINIFHNNCISIPIIKANCN